MNLKPFIRTSRWVVVPLASAVSGAFAATLTMSDVPLFLSSSVQPNIMWVVDDSGSMDWETLNSPGARDNFSFVPENDSNVDTTPSISAYDRNEVLQACYGVNVLYYDPTKIYTPWVGEDDAGNAFQDQPVDKAKNDPYYSGSGTRDLTADDNSTDQSGYFPWYDHNENGYLDAYVDINGNGRRDAFVDLNNNGVFDGFVDQDGDEIYDPWTDKDGDGDYDLDEFEFESEFECPDSGTSGSPIFTINQLTTWFVAVSEFKDLSGLDENDAKRTGIQLLTQAEQETNFANWYSYYRKREFVAKRSISEIVTNSTARMGLRTLHNNNSVNTNVDDVDDISTPIDTSAQANKEDLLDNVFQINSSGGTPLRRRLEDVGDYFVSSGGPILDEDKGGKCQQNFAIMMTDGVWNGSDPSVGNADSDNNTAFDGGTYADKNSGVSNTLADVAMKYYEMDMRPGYEDAVPNYFSKPRNEDPDQIHLIADTNEAQHMVTYTVAFGVTGNLDIDVPPDDSNFPGWPTPTSNRDSTIDDVWHAAYNGRGLFLSAKDPQALISSLNEAIQDIQGRDASASAVAVNSGQVSRSSMVYQAQFNSQQWSGVLKGIKLELDGSLERNAQTQELVANTASRVPSDQDQRTIVTMNDATRTAVPFRWNELSSNQQATLGDSNYLLYLRGSDDDEGGAYRSRVREGVYGPLGDIINSAPAYVGEAEFLYPDNLESASYTAYRLNPDGDNSVEVYENKTFRRTPVIYVGSNDGMLHAFNAFPDPTRSDFGDELFAYVPTKAYEPMASLGDKDYRHEYSVDGSPYVGDAFFDGAWNTVLLSGMNAGGQGIFALNVTDPNEFTTEASVASNVVMWEFTDDDDVDLGYTFGKPIIAKANSGQWVAIFGNGYNNTANDGAVGSGTAVLYIVDLETGTLLRKIDTGVRDLTMPNGLSSPSTLDVNGDYKVDYVYAGDLEGNLWKFDLTGTLPANWDVAYQGGGNQPLFTACKDANCTTSNRQSITVKPQVGVNKGATGHIVYFGTGTYFLQSDNNNLGLQSFYGIWDKHSTLLTSFEKEHLLQQEIIEEKVLANGSEQRRVTNYSIDWHTGTGLPVDNDSDGKIDTHMGWYLDLVNTENGNTNGYGERSISDALLRDQAIIFATSIPDDDPCAFGGTGWFMALDTQRGSQPEVAIIDVGGDGNKDNDYVAFDSLAPNEEPVASSGTKTDALVTQPVCVTTATGLENCVAPRSDAEVEETSIDAGFSLGRWSWQEL